MKLDEPLTGLYGDSYVKIRSSADLTVDACHQTPYRVLTLRNFIQSPAVIHLMARSVLGPTITQDLKTALHFWVLHIW